MKLAAQIFASVKSEGRTILLEPEAKTICRDYGLPIAKFRVAKTEAEAVKLAKEIGYPVVLKVISKSITHKSDVGGVILNLKNATAIQNAYKRIVTNVDTHQPEAIIEGMLIQEMVPPSTEIVVGAIKDPQFGPALMFGLGGIFVEVLKDVTFRIAPITADEAYEMISEIKAYPLLKGYRNKPPVDMEAIITILLNTSRLVMEHPIIKELDLNPIMVYKKGAKTVDARIILEDAATH